MQSCNKNFLNQLNINTHEKDLKNEKYAGGPKSNVNGCHSSTPLKYDDIASKYIKKYQKDFNKKVAYALPSNGVTKKKYSDYTNDYSDSESCSSSNEAVLIGGNEIAHSRNEAAPQISRKKCLSLFTFCHDMGLHDEKMNKVKKVRSDLIEKREKIAQVELAAKKKINGVLDFFRHPICAIQGYRAARKREIIEKEFGELQENFSAYSARISKNYAPFIDEEYPVNSKEFSEWMGNLKKAPLNNSGDAKEYLDSIEKTKNMLASHGNWNKNKSNKILRFLEVQEKIARNKIPNIEASYKSKRSAEVPKITIKVDNEKIDLQSNVVPLKNKPDGSQSETPAWKILHEFTFDSSKYTDAMALYVTQSSELQKKIDDLAKQREESLKLIKAPNSHLNDEAYNCELKRRKDKLHEENESLKKNMHDSADSIEEKYRAIMFNGSVEDAEFEKFLEGYKYDGSTNMIDRLNYLNEIDNAKEELGKLHYWPKNKSERFRDFLDQQGKKLRNEMQLEEQRMLRKDNQSNTNKSTWV